MILFLGDSFTWGQGLYFEDWHNKGLTNQINNHQPHIYPHENLSYEDNKIRKETHFPNLVAKHFNKNYELGRVYNGGSNWELLKILKELEIRHSIYEFIVFQFTMFTRPPHMLSYKFNKEFPHVASKFNVYDLQNLDGSFKRPELFDELLNTQFNEFDIILKNLPSNIKLLTLAWGDIEGDELKKRYGDRHIPILLNGKSYNSFDKILSMYDSHGNGLGLQNTIPDIFDGHLSKAGHRVVANSIIEKIKNLV